MQHAVALCLLLNVANAWHTPMTIRPTTRASRLGGVRLALPTGVSNGWLDQNCPPQAEAEKLLGVTISTDESLWEDNDFTPYIDEQREWTQVSPAGGYTACFYPHERGERRE